MATSANGTAQEGSSKGDLFPSVGSSNFLEFEFGGKSYTQQLQEAIQQTGKFSAVTVEIKQLNVRILPHVSRVEGRKEVFRPCQNSLSLPRFSMASTVF